MSNRNDRNNKDEQLYRANRTGQADAERRLRQAMTTWGDAVYRLALSQTRSRADAEDVYQDVFLRLHNSNTAFTSEEHLKAWLLRVTINRCHDLAKSAWKRRTVAFDPERDDVAEPAVAHDAEDAAVWQAVGQLPEQLRAAVHLHYADGYPTEDIARIMQCQPSTVRTWLFRARERIRQLMADEGEPAPSDSSNLRSAAFAQPQPPTAFGKEADHDRRSPEALPIDDEPRRGTCPST